LAKKQKTYLLLTLDGLGPHCCHQYKINTQASKTQIRLESAAGETQLALDKSIDLIDEADLTALVEAGTPELKTLEYKQAVPGRDDNSRKEFLADVSSFANSSGGHLIYGVREDAGVPVELIGLDEESDETIRRLESMVRDGTAPRIAVHSVAAKLANGRSAIVMRIPQSFASPHMVKFQNTSRFYARTSNGKYQLDVDEIRAAFLRSETTSERIRNFRLERVARIRARETPVAIPSGPSVALHIIPFNAFGNARYSVTRLASNPRSYLNLAPLFMDQANHSQINFDGLVVYNMFHDQGSDGFLQLYRSGIVEAVDARLISFGEKYDKVKVFSCLPFEVRLVRSVRKYLTVLESLGVDLPALLSLSLLDVRGYAMGRPDQGFLDAGRPFDRDVLMPQEALIESYTADVAVVAKPIFDELSNAAGFAESNLYADGEWIGEEVARRFGGV
jgi:hypothetical protein